MSDEERSLVHTSEFLVGDWAGMSLDRATDVAARMSEALESHPGILDGRGDYDEIALFELGYRCFGDDPVLVSDTGVAVAVLLTFLGDEVDNYSPLEWRRVDLKLKTIALALDMRRAVDPPPLEED